MNKKQRSLAADNMEQDQESLANQLVSRLSEEQQEIIKPAAKAWLSNIINSCRDLPYRVGEWTSQAAELADKAGLGLSELHALLQTFKTTAIANLRDKASDADKAAVCSILSDAADQLLQNVVDYYARRSRECEVAEQRKQKAMIDAVNRPLALLDAEGIIDAANRDFGRCLNTTPDLLLRRDIAALCDDATAAQLRAALRLKPSKQQSKTFDGVVTQGGNAVATRFYVQPLFDISGLRTGAVVCLDQEKQADDADQIHLVEDRVLSILPFPIQVVDATGNVSFSSEEVKLAAPRAYDGKEPLCCFLYKGQRACPCADVFKTGLFHIEELCYSSAGETRWYLVLMLPIPDAAGQVRHVVCCTYDMTRRKQIHKQLESQIITQQRSSLVAQIAVTVAHQLRNPLSVVLGFAEMMSKGLPPEQHYEAVTRILRNSIRCKDIVENLLDFGKGMPLERRPVDMSLLLTESVRPLLTPAQNRLIEWRLAKEPAMVECVPEQLVQVVLSLLDNALQVAQSRIMCVVEAKKESVRLRIVDDGPGIPLDQRDRVFDPFFTTRRSSGAVGLGLSLARAVANDYGGNLAVGSSIGEEPNGACLVLQLPKILTAEAPEEAAQEEPVAAHQRVLVIDDEADLLDLLKTSLYQRGYVVDTAASGPEAIQKLKENTYNAVIIDYQLSGTMNGRDVFEHLEQEYPQLIEHSLFITADTMNYQTRMFLESIRRPVLEKPFLMADFISMLNKLC